MKRLICLTAALAVVATPAFAQLSFQQGTPVVFKDTSTGEAESRMLAELIYRALDRSRSLRLVPTVDEHTMELDAPRALVKEADGARITVRYEITPPRGSTQEFTAICTTTKLQQCAETIVQRAERLVSITSMRR